MTVILSEYGSLPQKAERLAEIIADYDPTLELRWIPPDKRTIFDAKPFAIWQNAPGHAPYIVMTLAENELDHRVLAALFRANNESNDVLATIEAEEAARQVMKIKAQIDEAEANREFATWVLSQNKTVTHNGIKYV